MARPKMTEEQFIAKRNEIAEESIEYVSEGALNISKLRLESPNLYGRVKRYYNSTKDLADCLGVTIYRNKKGKESFRDGRKILRDKLALLFLITCFKQGMTYERIAKRFGVTRQAVCSLYQSLQSGEYINGKV